MNFSAAGNCGEITNQRGYIKIVCTFFFSFLFFFTSPRIMSTVKNIIVFGLMAMNVNNLFGLLADKTSVFRGTAVVRNDEQATTIKSITANSPNVSSLTLPWIMQVLEKLPQQSRAMMLLFSLLGQLARIFCKLIWMLQLRHLKPVLRHK